MAHSGRSRYPRTSGVRRQTSWGTGPKSGASGLSVSISASSTNLGGIVAVPASDGITLIRTRGELVFALETADALSSGFRGAFGIGIATDDAIAIGVTALPMPIGQETWDGWLYHTYFAALAAEVMGAANASSTVSGTAALNCVVRREVDSKAMRKIPVGMTLYCALEVTETNTATARWSFNSRTLVKLP